MWFVAGCRGPAYCRACSWWVHGPYARSPCCAIGGGRKCVLVPGRVEVTLPTGQSGRQWLSLPSQPSLSMGLASCMHIPSSSPFSVGELDPDLINQSHLGRSDWPSSCIWLDALFCAGSIAWLRSLQPVPPVPPVPAPPALSPTGTLALMSQVSGFTWPSLDQRKNCSTDPPPPHRTCPSWAISVRAPFLFGCRP